LGSIVKPNKDKVLIISEARSGSTALWTYLWAKYYQDGIDGKPVRTWIEPFNYTTNKFKNEKVKNARMFLRYVLTQPDDPWLIKVLYKQITPIEKDVTFRRITGLINKSSYAGDRLLPQNGETEEQMLNRSWEHYFNATEKRLFQQSLSDDLFYNDPSVYRIKLARRDIIHTIMSHLELDLRETKLEVGLEVKNDDSHWHAKAGMTRPIYEFPDYSEMDLSEVAELAQFWYLTHTNQNLLNLSSTSTPSMAFDAEYYYEDIIDELQANNPVIKLDETNPMHAGATAMCNKSGIIITDKPPNYQETYNVIKQFYTQWKGQWDRARDRRGLQRFEVHKGTGDN